MKAPAILMISAIPAVLGLGAIYWLTFGEGVHSFDRQVSQERKADAQVARMHAEVHAPLKPVSKVQVSIVPGNLVQITKAVLDGTSLQLFYRNSAHTRREFIEFHFKGYAPDGTIVWTDEMYGEQIGGAIDLEIGERAIATETVSDDDRIVKITVRITSQHYDTE